MTLHLAPAVGALVTEALARSGATREELQQERNRRKNIRTVAMNNKRRTGIPNGDATERAGCGRSSVRTVNSLSQPSSHRNEE